MADAVAVAERDKYARMWQHDSYRARSPGLRFLPHALTLLKMQPGAAVIDLGCGTGRVAAALAGEGFDAAGVDLVREACTDFDGPFVEACLWDLPEDFGRYPFGFCADVMEHIPTERVGQTLANIAKHVECCYFQIANFHCHEGEKIGETLHLTVKGLDWWLGALECHFDIIHSKAEPKHHIIVCKSRAF